jgi:hypothetical protein
METGGIMKSKTYFGVKRPKNLLGQLLFARREFIFSQ